MSLIHDALKKAASTQQAQDAGPSPSPSPTAPIKPGEPSASLLLAQAIGIVILLLLLLGVGIWWIWGGLNRQPEQEPPPAPSVSETKASPTTPPDISKSAKIEPPASPKPAPAPSPAPANADSASGWEPSEDLVKAVMETPLVGGTQEEDIVEILDAQPAGDTAPALQAEQSMPAAQIIEVSRPAPAAQPPKANAAIQRLVKAIEIRGVGRGRVLLLLPGAGEAVAFQPGALVDGASGLYLEAIETDRITFRDAQGRSYEKAR